MTRIDGIMRDSLFNECLAKIEKREEDRRFCRHNFQHFLDTARITYILLLESRQINELIEENKLNQSLARDIVYASGLLHDIGRWQEYDTGEDHAAASARIAVAILEKTGFNQAEIRLIVTGITEHRRMSKAMSILGRYLYKADKLSRPCFVCKAVKDCYKYNQMQETTEGQFY